MNENIKLALVSGFIGVPIGVVYFWVPELLERHTSIDDNYILAFFFFELLVANFLVQFILGRLSSWRLKYLRLVLLAGVFAMISSVSSVISLIFGEGLTPKDHVVLVGFGVTFAVQILFSLPMALIFRKKHVDLAIDESISSFGQVEKEYNFEE